MIRQPYLLLYAMFSFFISTVVNAQQVKHDSLTTPQLQGSPDNLPLPSPQKPVANNTPQLKLANEKAYAQYSRQQHFSRHPEAKAYGYEVFPGAIPAGAPRVTQTITIQVLVGSQGLTDNLTQLQTRLHSTGLYVPAGEKVTITLDDADLNQGLAAQIGVHNNIIFNLDSLRRIPLDLTTKFILKKKTEVYSPYGGLLSIAIADDWAPKTLTMKVEGAVKVPYFRLGQTSEKEWVRTIRNNPAPWAELATNNIVLTVPSYRIRNLTNPVKLMRFWDKVMNADADLAGMPRVRKHQERIIVDNDVAYAYMFTTLDKITVPDDKSCEWMLDEAFMRKNGSWGTFHELGHRHQYWPFEDEATQEVTVNLYTMYVYDHVLHKGLYNHPNISSKEAHLAEIEYYFSHEPSYQKWRSDPFLALDMYIEIINAFGWDAIKAVSQTYRTLPENQFPQTPQQKIDFRFTTLCKATNSNLTRFFEVWQVPVSAAAKEEVKNYKTWFPVEFAKYE